MSVLIGNNLGDITNLANDYLPKSAIDRTTIRMAELLQHRMGADARASATITSASSTPVASASSTSTTPTTPTV